mmetsp:Transcript_17432/g.41874  ORF Transcript_17432/g.41874 Transcript_17432/m.41874 type:complete len:83 (-) Transcript_17432:18-266(-)
MRSIFKLQNQASEPSFKTQLQNQASEPARLLIRFDTNEADPTVHLPQACLAGRTEKKKLCKKEIRNNICLMMEPLPLQQTHM